MNRPIRTTPLLFATLVLSAPLLAHPPGMRAGMDMGGDMFATMDADHDGRISAKEHAAAAQAMFAQADANHDGYVTRDEMQAMHAGRDAAPQGMQAPAPGAPGTPASAMGKPTTPMDHDDRMPANGGMHHDMDMGDHFKAMDADGDGRISAGEHAAGAAKMFASMDTDHDGFLSRGEFDAGHAAMMGRGMDHAGMFEAMDADGDGRISASEHAAGAARMFASMDTDHDGFLSRGEFDAGHARMMSGGAMHPDMGRDPGRMDDGDTPDRHDDHAGHR